MGIPIDEITVGEEYASFEVYRRDGRTIPYSGEAVHVRVLEIGKAAPTDTRRRARVEVLAGPRGAIDESSPYCGIHVGQATWVTGRYIACPWEDFLRHRETTNANLKRRRRRRTELAELCERVEDHFAEHGEIEADYTLDEATDQGKVRITATDVDAHRFLTTLDDLEVEPLRASLHAAECDTRILTWLLHDVGIESPQPAGLQIEAPAGLLDFETASARIEKLTEQVNQARAVYIETTADLLGDDFSISRFRLSASSHPAVRELAAAMHATGLTAHDGLRVRVTEQDARRITSTPDPAHVSGVASVADMIGI